MRRVGLISGFHRSPGVMNRRLRAGVMMHRWLRSHMMMVVVVCMNTLRGVAVSGSLGRSLLSHQRQRRK